jgi:glycine betaine/proline transport system substrate-binding protein
MKTHKINIGKILCGLSLGLSAALISGCGGSSDDATSASADSSSSDSAKTARLTYVNWAEGVAYTNLAKAVLDQKMGYDTEITMVDVGPAYMAVASGDYDAYMECWRALHKDYLREAKEGERVVSLGNVYEGTVLGLAVPAYVPINKISEMKGNEDKFGGRIVGIDAGAGMMKTISEEIIPDYGLDIELLPSSGPAMTAALGEAISQEEWIVVPVWKPHWLFGRWDVKILEQDADKAVWKSGNIEIIGRSDLAQDKPELEQFLRNMYLTDEELSSLMLAIEESDQPVGEVAREWMREHPEAWEDWIPQS